MTTQPRMSGATLAVLRAFIDDPTRPMYGLQVAKDAGIATGTLYPILDRLEKAGWLIGEWETGDPSVEGRPLRRHYRLTADGAQLATEALRAAQQRFTPRAWLPQPSLFGARA